MQKNYYCRRCQNFTHCNSGGIMKETWFFLSRTYQLWGSAFPQYPEKSPSHTFVCLLCRLPEEKAVFRSH
jgi:hypothetical protein